MQLLIFVTLLVAALLTSGVAIRIGMRSTASAAVQYATVAAAAGVFLWVLVGIGSFNVVTVSNGAEIQNSYPALGTLGLAGTAANVAVVVKGAITLLGE